MLKKNNSNGSLIFWDFKSDLSRIARFPSLARANERVHVHNERNFPPTKLDSEINVPFLLNDTSMVTYIFIA